MSIVLTPVGIPVETARLFVQALVPRNAGGWNWIGQFYNQPFHNPSEWVVMHLETATYHIDTDDPYTPGSNGRYANVNYQINHQIRAGNGRVFFPAVAAWWWYYDPTTEHVIDMGRVPGTSDTALYSMVFNESGDRLYGGTIGNNSTTPKWLPCVVEFDPNATPPTATFMARIGGSGHTQGAYAYYLWADGDWLYALVGEEVWDVVAVHIPTRAWSVLITATVNAWAFFKQIGTEGLTVQLITNYGYPNQTINQFWVNDGQMYPYTVGVPPPFTPHDVTPYENPVVQPPQIDTTPVPDAMLWRPFGSTGAWTQDDFAINYAAPIPIESLGTLPDGTIFGDVEKYQGFFRYSPTTSIITYYGAFAGITETSQLNAKGNVYMTGYPNGVLYEYNPSAPWVVPSGPTQNPKRLGYYSNGVTFSGVKRGRVLAYSSMYDRLYMVGLRDRTAAGSGIGYYNFATSAFAGTFANLNFYDGHLGLAIFDNLDRVVMGGRIGDDPNHPGQTPTESQLVLYDHNLVEIERQTPIAGLIDTGKLFRTNEANVVVGVSIEDRRLYRWNIVTKSLLAQVDFTAYGEAGEIAQDVDGTIIMVMGDQLVNVDPLTLVITSLGTLDDPALVGFAPRGDDLYTGLGAELNLIGSGTPVDFSLTMSATGVLLTPHDAQLSEGVANELDAAATSVSITTFPMELLVDTPIAAFPSLLEIEPGQMSFEIGPLPDRMSLLELKLHNIDLLSGSVDPSSGGGIAAAIGSLYLRSGTPELWQKTGAAATAWAEVRVGAPAIVVSYVAAGGETDVMIPIGQTLDTVSYGVSWAPAGMASIPSNLDLPTTPGDRTFTAFRITTAALTAGDRLTFLVYP